MNERERINSTASSTDEESSSVSAQASPISFTKMKVETPEAKNLTATMSDTVEVSDRIDFSHEFI